VIKVSVRRRRELPMDPARVRQVGDMRRIDVGARPTSRSELEEWWRRCLIGRRRNQLLRVWQRQHEKGPQWQSEKGPPPGRRVGRGGTPGKVRVEARALPGTAIGRKRPTGLTAAA